MDQKRKDGLKILKKKLNEIIQDEELTADAKLQKLYDDSEITEFGLNGNSDLLSNVCHLQGFLSEIPLIPVIVWLYILFLEMNWSLSGFINHEWC